ncbi:MAG: GlsB/YeaQ/YmgE family stress response membrane protein [Anaerolineae bacterium]|nr:GlsB/YeaQ/YmgE family stress response membrane protein [Anaerolineae bacterium]
MFISGFCGCLQCLWVIIVGGTAGFLAGYVIRGRGYNPVGNVLLGIAGFFMGSLLFRLGGIPNLCSVIIVSVVGAIVLILLVRVFIDAEFAK